QILSLFLLFIFFCSVHIRSAGRFVTRRRRVASTRPPSARVSLLNSSEDFTSGPFGASVNQQPSRRRRFPPAFGLSSAESSVNAATNTNPSREISLNELAENSLGPVPSKPIFCSTPSAPNFNKQKYPKCPSQVASPPSALGSSIGVLSTFQEDPDSMRQPGSLYVEKLQKESSLHCNEEQSLDLFPEPDRRGCSGKAKRHRGDLEGNKSATVNLLSADSDSSSLFVSAAGGLEWLIEGLKERCLSQTCRVQLQRLNILSMTQLYGQTTYSSCLEQSGPETKGWPPFAEGIQTVGFCSEGSAHPSVSVTTDKTRGHVQSVIDSDTSASVSDCRIVNFSKSPELLDRNTNRQSSESVIYVVDTQSSYENIMDTQLPGGNAAPTQLTDEEAKTAKSKCTKKCFVRIKNLPLSQLHDHGFTQYKGVGVVCSLNHLEKMRGMVLLTESEHNPEAKTESDSSEETAALTSVPKEKCLTSKAVVKAKKISLSELIEILQPKGGGPKLSTDVSDSSSDNQTKTDSECSEDTTSLKIASKSSSSASSGKEVEKSGRSVPKRNKRPLAPKERRRGSPSADRTGTTRKACVSGMSVNRWKNKEAAGALAFRSRDAKQLSTSTAVDCSISELNSKQHNQPKVRAALMTGTLLVFTQTF
ncbi:hypothetical protein XENOCAPTIV_009534, partial [Xenoophorus captivus]